MAEVVFPLRMLRWSLRRTAVAGKKTAWCLRCNRRCDVPPWISGRFHSGKITRTPFKSLVRYGRTISGNNDLEKRKRLLIDSLHSIRHQPECFGWRGESFKSRYNDRQVVYILRVEQEWKSAICVWPRSHLRVAEMPRGRSRGADWGISYNLGLPPFPIPSSLHVACA